MMNEIEFACCNLYCIVHLNVGCKKKKILSNFVAVCSTMMENALILSICFDKSSLNEVLTSLKIWIDHINIVENKFVSCI